MTTEIGVDISADVSGLDLGFSQAEKLTQGFSGSVQRSSVEIAASAQKMADSLSMSAKQTAFAMRMVPAQMTDIVTQLAGGQSPFLVMIQQGGQLKDMFGGIGPAARAMGTYIAGLVNPFSIAAVAAGALAYAYYEGALESETFTKTLIMTGNAAGTTAGLLMDSSRRVSEATGATQGASAEAMNQLAATGKVSADVMERATQAAIDLERAGVKSIQETVKEFAELGKDPVKASERLNEKYHYLTVSVYEQIRALKEQGRTDEAAALAQRTYSDEMDARANRITANLNMIGKSWKFVTDQAKKGWDALLNIGREDSLTDQLSKAQGELDKIILARNGKRALGSSKAREDLDNADYGNEAAARLKIEGIKEQIALTDRLSRSQVENNKQVDEAIRKANEKATGGGSSGRSREPTDDFGPLMNRLSGLNANYSKELNTLYGAYEKGKLGIDEYRMAVEELILKQPFAVKAAQDDKRALDERLKVFEATTRAEEHAGKAMTDFSVKTSDRVEAIQRQIELLGQTPENASRINAFADIDRQANALRITLENLRIDVLKRGGDTTKFDDLLEKLPELVVLAKDDAAAALGKLKDATDALNASWEYGADEALRKYLDEVGNVAAKSEQLVTNSFKGMEDAFVEWSMTGKTNSKSLFDSIIRDLIRMQMQANVTGPLAGLLNDVGGIGGLFKEFTGGWGTADRSGIGSAMSLMNSLHTGGIVGSDEGSGLRSISPIVFKNASRFHTGGIAGDEVPIIAKRGEGVFTQGQMQALGRSSAPTSITVEINNNGTAQNVTSAQPSFDARGLVLSIITEDIDRNGPVTSSLASKFNLAQRAY